MKHGWFVLVRGLEGTRSWECAYTELFSSKREARRMLREYRKDNAHAQYLSFYLAKAVVVPVRDEVAA
jgi:hypothetical protein